MPKPREQHRADQRAAILEVARRLFAESGPEDVTMAEVASEAGVSRATVFNYFGSKHALIAGITEDVPRGYQTLLEDALAERETPVPALVRTLFDRMGSGIEADRRFHRAAFREIAKLSLGVDEGGPGQQAREANLERLLHLMTRGQARAELSGEHRPEDLASAFDALVFGTITHWLYDDASESLQARMARAAEIFLGGAGVGDGTAVSDARGRGRGLRPAPGRRAPPPKKIRR
jgi:AcrR family transcriptional regulator